jgi:hypothetical protein
VKGAPVALLVVVLAACGGDGDVAPSVSSADTIAAFDNPNFVTGPTSRRLADIVRPGDVGRRIGVPAHLEPYPDYEWHFRTNGIDFAWNPNGVDPRSPLEKWMATVDPASLQAARDWNRLHHGTGAPGLQSWWGLCTGWSGSAVYQARPRRAVSVRLGSTGHVERCGPWDSDCTRFEVGDVHGLLAEVFSDGPSFFTGARCDSPTVVFDANGRVDRTRNGAGCKGLNPGSALVVLADRIRREGKGLVMNYQDPTLTDAIWNRPVHAYVVERTVPLQEADAIRLVARSGPAPGSYVWNQSARGFVRIDFSLFYVEDTKAGPSARVVPTADHTKQMQLSAIVELDRPSSDPNAVIVGGEYIEDRTRGTGVLTVPTYFWVPTGPSSDDAANPEWWNTFPHNPWVRTSLVRELAAIAAH